MQAVVWSPQLGSIVKELKTLGMGLGALETLAQTEQRAVQKTFDSESERKVEIREQWF